MRGRVVRIPIDQHRGGYGRDAFNIFPDRHVPWQDEKSKHLNTEIDANKAVPRRQIQQLLMQLLISWYSDGKIPGVRK